MPATPRPELGTQPSIVYLVEPDPQVRARLRALLRTPSIQVRECSSAEAFLQALTSERPACVIVDTKLPGMDGLALQCRLRDLAPDLPVIVTSRDGDVPTAVAAMREGALGFFEKPFVDRAIVARVHEGFARQRRPDALSTPLDDDPPRSPER